MEREPYGGFDIAGGIHDHESLEQLLATPSNVSSRQQTGRPDSISRAYAPSPSSNDNRGPSWTELRDMSSMQADRQTPEVMRSPEQQYSRLRWNNMWIREYFVIFLSLGCMAAIAIILIAVHGKPLSRWRLFASPNALISIFAAISKSAMLLALAEAISQLKWIYFQSKAQRLQDFQTFDDASRGPWGALKLLATIGVRAWIASVGALIIILSLAMDPFVQQILKYRTQMVIAINATATIGTANVFDSGAGKNPLVQHFSLGNFAQYPSK